MKEEQYYYFWNDEWHECKHFVNTIHYNKGKVSEDLEPIIRLKENKHENKTKHIFSFRYPFIWNKS